MEKSVTDTLLDRRCVRHYEARDVSDEDRRFIREAVRNSPTSYNGQQYSVIEITDSAIKNQMAEITKMKQLATAPVVYMFLIDYHKIELAAKAKGMQAPDFPDTADGLIVGVIDASLAMMSAIVAAESRGLGTCPAGYARTVNPSAICGLLKLPEKVFPVCALAVGIPAKKPDLKPKEPLDLLFFKDTYGSQGMAEELLAYDREIVKYHQSRDSRTSDEDWIGKILSYYEEGMSYKIMEALRAQGFGIIK